MGIPHRLDRPVSGVVILAKTSKALSRMAMMFKEKEVEKIYHAIVVEVSRTGIGNPGALPHQEYQTE